MRVYGGRCTGCCASTLSSNRTQFFVRREFASLLGLTTPLSLCTRNILIIKFVLRSENIDERKFEMERIQPCSSECEWMSGTIETNAQLSHTSYLPFRSVGHFPDPTPMRRSCAVVICLVKISHIRLCMLRVELSFRRLKSFTRWNRMQTRRRDDIHIDTSASAQSSNQHSIRCTKQQDVNDDANYGETSRRQVKIKLINFLVAHGNPNRHAFASYLRHFVATTIPCSCQLTLAKWIFSFPQSPSLSLFPMDYNNNKIVLEYRSNRWRRVECHHEKLYRKCDRMSHGFLSGERLVLAHSGPFAQLVHSIRRCCFRVGKMPAINKMCVVVSVVKLVNFLGLFIFKCVWHRDVIIICWRPESWYVDTPRRSNNISGSSHIPYTVAIDKNDVQQLATTLYTFLVIRTFACTKHKLDITADESSTKIRSFLWHPLP